MYTYYIYVHVHKGWIKICIHGYSFEIDWVCLPLDWNKITPKDSQVFADNNKEGLIDDDVFECAELEFGVFWSSD